MKFMIYYLLSIKIKFIYVELDSLSNLFLKYLNNN